MWLLILLAAFVWMLLHLRMARTILALGLFAWSLLLLTAAFLTGALLTVIFDSASVRQWKLPASWVTQLVDSDVGLWVVFFIPLVFVGDVVKWIFYITIFHGSLPLWVCMTIGAVGVYRTWYYGISSFHTAAEDR
jgi:hypothetical protein